MAIFGTKKKADALKSTAEVATTAKASGTPVMRTGLHAVIVGPRITEKAALTAETNVYVFDVATTATKRTIAEAINMLYKVMPVSVNVINIPRKRVIVRGKKGMKGGGKKAYVYLKAGDKIEII